MRVGKLSAAEMAERRQVMLQTAFRLFSERNIESVSMADVAAETSYNLRSFQRYFHSKNNLVIETATWVFDSFVAQYRARRRRPVEETTAAEDYEFFLDSFLDLYRNHADILRFNQFFNVYVRSEKIDAGQLQPYGGMIDALRERFRAVYEKRDAAHRLPGGGHLLRDAAPDARRGDALRRGLGLRRGRESGAGASSAKADAAAGVHDHRIAITEHPLAKDVLCYVLRSKT